MTVRASQGVSWNTLQNHQSVRLCNINRLFLGVPHVRIQRDWDKQEVKLTGFARVNLQSPASSGYPPSGIIWSAHGVGAASVWPVPVMALCLSLGLSFTSQSRTRRCGLPNLIRHFTVRYVSKNSTLKENKINPAPCPDIHPFSCCHSHSGTGICDGNRKNVTYKRCVITQSSFCCEPPPESPSFLSPCSPKPLLP